MKKVIFFTSVIFLLASNVFAAPPAKEALCRACHGAEGGKPLMDAYPKLKGQNKAYLISSLTSYKEGKRAGGMAAVMGGQAKSLSQADIEALADYYSKL